jgi:transposase InsO family protein
VRFHFIQAEKAHYPISLMCRLLDVSRSGFYAWLRRGCSPRQQQDQELGEQIDQIHHKSHRTYGSPRVHAELRAQGVRCGKKRVARLMRQRGLSARRRRSKIRTTDSRHGHPVAPERLGRDFAVEQPNRVWVSDITYIPTGQGWLYLAVIVDLYSRMVVGWAMSRCIDKELVLSALEMAVARRKPEAGLIHHSDRGSQYASDAYQQMLQAYGMVASMSHKGDCWDNAVAESFFASLKVERVNEQDYGGPREARMDVFEYIEVFYNRVRRHSYLGYRSPLAFEEAGKAMSA